jgi:putative metallohydrolase (TIGR04338 family)
MQGWADDLAANDWFLARWGDRAFDVRPGFGHRRATADANGVLQMPKWARSELVLLHEVAHCLTPSAAAAHGPEYAGVLLALARRGMGPATGQALEDAFTRHRVRWTLSAVPPAAGLSRRALSRP